MKKIIIVDDRYEKIETLGLEYEELSDCQVTTCHSATEALQIMRQDFFDILIIDIQIPDRLGSAIKENGGIKLIEAISIRSDINKPTYIVGATSHEASYSQHQELFREHGWPLVLTSKNPSQLGKIVRSKVSYLPIKPKKADVGIITALRRVELEAVLDLPIEWKKEQIEADGQIYYSGTFKTSVGDSKTIVATSCSRMGIASSACITSKFIDRYHPEYLFMTGIAAGIKGRVDLGDIMIADPVWDWGSGKQTVKNAEPRHLAAPHQISLETSYRPFFQSIATDRTYLDEIRNRWGNKGKIDGLLNLHLGPIATGSVVLEDPDVVESIKLQHRELNGIEMEGYGFSFSAHSSSQRPKLSAVVKSVCDFADLEKNDDYQSYAAFTSANFVYEIIRNDLYI